MTPPRIVPVPATEEMVEAAASAMMADWRKTSDGHRIAFLNNVRDGLRAALAASPPPVAGAEVWPDDIGDALEAFPILPSRIRRKAAAAAAKAPVAGDEGGESLDFDAIIRQHKDDERNYVQALASTPPPPADLKAKEIDEAKRLRDRLCGEDACKIDAGCGCLYDLASALMAAHAAGKAEAIRESYGKRALASTPPAPREENND